MKRALNLYEYIFGTFLILKLAGITAVASFGWFWILLPIILNFIHLFFSWVWDTLDFSKTARSEIIKIYYDQIFDKERKKAVKKFKKNI